MFTENRFYKTVIKIAIPVTLQSLLQSSFGVADQMMTGQLGSVSIAGIGLSSKFTSVFSVLVSAIAAVAGIMIAQYVGQKDDEEVSRCFCVNLFLAVILAVFFTMLSAMCPQIIMRIYTRDQTVRKVAAGYLRIVSVTYLPIAISSLTSVLLRCMEKAELPMYASICSAVMNTGLNYVLIFGKCGIPKMGVQGAAIATVISQSVNCVLLLVLFLGYYGNKGQKLVLKFTLKMTSEKYKQYLGILLPILICEFLWTLCENIYAVIYGHIGTEACAAMTLTTPIQVLMIGALSGVSQAAGVIIGKTLGSGDNERAYEESKKLMKYGLIGSILLSVLLIFLSNWYVSIYQVESHVRMLACQILFAFALIAPVKVQNMILGGGIIRSGGKTKYIMWIDFVGTWLFGVPLGFLTAFVLKLEIPYVYFILSLEECVRLGISFVVFRKRNWMMQL